LSGREQRENKNSLRDRKKEREIHQFKSSKRLSENRQLIAATSIKNDQSSNSSITQLKKIVTEDFVGQYYQQ
jgi:hypothetical protein